MKTLEKFIEEQGSNREAAKKIGVDIGTVFRWKAGTATPRGLYAKRLKRLGVEV